MINPSKFPRRLLSRIIPPALLLMASANLFAQPVADEEFSALTKRLQGEKPTFAKRQQTLLEERYDLADRPAKGVTMSRGKPVQDGVRVKLPGGITWDKLAAMTPAEIKDQKLWPAGFYRCRIPITKRAAWSSRKFHIDEIRKQTERDLTRFDLDFDLPDHFLPEFPAPIYLTTRPDLGDVSQGQARHARQLLRAVQGHPQSQAARRPAAAGHAISRSSSSTRPKTAAA